jgi:nucleotide-binding universal stress UspA family protein
MFPTKVLLATDGSEEAGRAAWVAATLSGRLGCELHVVCVEPLQNLYPIPEATLYNRVVVRSREGRGGSVPRTVEEQGKVQV